MDLSWDDFMDRLADKFRGPVDVIGNEQKARYLSETQKAYDTVMKPVLDIGSGRGEWLRVLQNAKIPARGVELNPIQVSRLREQGLDVHLGDALKLLQQSPSGSFSAITALQVVEHWNGPLIWDAIKLAHRGLGTGGILILETVNVSSVWAWNHFAYDPTHVSPLPPELLAFMVEEAGFTKVETRYFSPIPLVMQIPSDTPQWQFLNKWLYGPQDYAVLGCR